MTTFRRRRMRRVLKWGGVGLSLLIAGAWSASLWWEFLYVRAGSSYCSLIDIGVGCAKLTWIWDQGYLQILRSNMGSKSGDWGLRSIAPAISPVWQPSYVPEATMFQLTLPLWMPFLLVAIPTAFLFWRDRRRFPPGHCQRCGYDLTGNTSGVCPECGVVAPGERDEHGDSPAN